MSTRYRPGIYRIVNTVTAKQYIGSSVSIGDRWNTHRTRLKANRHHSSYLQNSWNKYGSDAFVFEVLLYCDTANLNMYEQLCFDTFKPEYNIQPEARTTRNQKLSDQHKANISAGLKGKPKSSEHSANVAAALRGKKYPNSPAKSDEHKEKTRQAIKLYWANLSPEERAIRTAKKSDRAVELETRLKRQSIAPEHLVT